MVVVAFIIWSFLNRITHLGRPQLRNGTERGRGQEDRNLVPGPGDGWMDVLNGNEVRRWAVVGRLCDCLTNRIEEDLLVMEVNLQGEGVC